MTDGPNGPHIWTTFEGQPVWGTIADTDWSTARIELLNASGRGIDDFLSALRETLNCGLFEFRRFSVHPVRNFDWFYDGHVWSDVGPGKFARAFLAHPVVQAELGEVLSGADAAQTNRFERTSPLALDGLLAQQLVDGGSQFRFRGEHRAAKALAAGFCRDLFGERYEDVQVAHASFAWTHWFCDIAWDRTWIVIDKGTCAVSVLCSTDDD